MTPQHLRQIHQRMKAVASVAKLPLRSGRWSGVAGSVLGLGTGSSIDFQDQRPYLPGDDPRHINWQAYARTGNHTMKLYRQEVTPRIDVLFDASASMFLTDEKAQRTWELLYFCLESSLRLGASLKIHELRQSTQEIVLEKALAGDWTFAEESHKPDLAGLISRIPLRPGSLRVLLSDLLSDHAPERIVSALLHGRGRGMILAPYCQEEAQPDWSGNIEFEDNELQTREKRRVEKGVMDRYLKAYEMHFMLWRDQCARRGVGMARVTSGGEILDALIAEALGAGVIEM